MKTRSVLNPFLLPLLLVLLAIGCKKEDDNVVQDVDGNSYNTVTIGTQTWMAKNLNTTKYNDGAVIPNITDANAWDAFTTGAYCDYENTPANSDVYGKLYNWYSVSTGKLCPTGWHIPSHEECITLLEYLGGTTVAGSKLKESGTSHWVSPNTGATNESGFTALPSGWRGFSGESITFGSLGYITLWWTSSDMNGPISMTVNESTSILSFSSPLKQWGNSVRCLKDN